MNNGRILRRINGWISLGMIVLILVHLISGAFQMFGILAGGSQIRKGMSYALLLLVCMHAVIGVILTAETLRTEKKAGASYPGANRMFWIRRVSGYAMLLLLVTHLLIFITPAGESFRLHSFAGLQLACSLLLVLSMCIHVLSNIRPLLITFGASKLRKILIDVLWILSAVLLLSAAAFVVYYLRWNVLWR